MLIFHHLNITLFLIITTIFHQGYNTDVITVTQTMPSSVIAGAEFTVELTITKGSITSFAKVQQELPLGFTATAIEAQQANFSFNNQVVKFIWKSLPEESEFQLSYKIAVSADEVSGIKSIGGIFAYLENNERRVVDIPPYDIFIQGSGDITGTEVQLTDETALETELQPTSPTFDETDPAYIISSRETTEEINGNSESSPSEILPESIEESEIIPQDEGEETTESTEPATLRSQNETLANEDAYGEETGKAVEELTEFADETVETSTSLTPLASVETKEEVEPTLENPSNPVPTYITPPAKRSIEYRVQIAAAYKNISTTHFLNTYNITERINQEVHNEMNKYTVGSFSNYRSAMEHVNFIRNNKGVEGAFITAYDNGKRITVKEAFSISRPDWSR